MNRPLFYGDRDFVDSTRFDSTQETIASRAAISTLEYALSTKHPLIDLFSLKPVKILAIRSTEFSSLVPEPILLGQNILKNTFYSAIKNTVKSTPLI